MARIDRIVTRQGISDARRTHFGAKGGGTRARESRRSRQRTDERGAPPRKPVDESAIRGAPTHQAGVERLSGSTAAQCVRVGPYRRAVMHIFPRTPSRGRQCESQVVSVATRPMLRGGYEM